MSRETGPALNALEYKVWHQVPHDKGIRVNTLVWLTAEDPATVRRTLEELERLGYVTHGGGTWRRNHRP